MTDYKYTWSAWAEAFAIFAKYEKDYETNFAEVAAEHDCVYAADAKVISDEDKARLKELNWHINEDGHFYHFV